MRKALMTALFLASAGMMQAATLFELPSPNAFRNDSWAFGEIFTVGPQNITVTGLGAFDASGDGFISQGGIPVGIFRESDSFLLTSVNVQSTDPLTNHFRYAAITPLLLFSGEQYRVVAVNLNDLYNIDLAFSVDPAVTWNSYAYGQSTTLQSLNGFTGTERIWMANLQFDGGDTGVIPEPATSVLAGVGLLLVALRVRRQRLAGLSR